MQDDHLLRRPFCYEKHLHFLNAAEYNLTNPIYINIVRHPIKRIISWYYYARSTNYIFQESTPRYLPDLKMMKRTFEECVRNKHSDCTYPIGMYFKFIRLSYLKNQYLVVYVSLTFIFITILLTRQ